MFCDSLEGDGDEMGGVQAEGVYVCLWLIGLDEWQRPTQDYRAMVLHNCILFYTSPKEETYPGCMLGKIHDAQQQLKMIL